MRKRREPLTPDLTPLIDVVFILLIFFMVSSVFKKEDVTLALDLPSLHAKSQTTQNEHVTIELASDKLVIDKKEHTFESLPTLFSTYKKETVIEIHIDKKVEYERIMNLFDQLQKHDLTSFSLVAQEAD